MRETRNAACASVQKKILHSCGQPRLILERQESLPLSARTHGGITGSDSFCGRLNTRSSPPVPRPRSDSVGVPLAVGPLDIALKAALHSTPRTNLFAREVCTRVLTARGIRGAAARDARAHLRWLGNEGSPVGFVVPIHDGARTGAAAARTPEIAWGGALL